MCAELSGESSVTVKKTRNLKALFNLVYVSAAGTSSDVELSLALK